MIKTCTECEAEIQPKVTELIQHGSRPDGWSQYYTAKIAIACECTAETPKTGQKTVDLQGEIPKQWQSQSNTSDSEQ